jgi:D-arabinose 1-dehydrogenase-like Zn-dependent alcohol dehydrogenase
MTAMRAVVYEKFGEPAELREVPEPVCAPDAAIVAVRATGLCRSDWHGWMGHDPDITLPHVPGHELAGEVVAVGSLVRGWRPGQRVTAPFVCACGTCAQCASGDHQVCARQEQPGFTYWGSFADLVAIPRADVNLVALPDDLTYEAAASLGCRYATAFRAVADVGRLAAGEWVAVHGCGGVGLSAVAIAAASGARVVAVDVDPGALALAEELGAAALVNAREHKDPGAAVAEASGGGVHLSLDALGSAATCVGSVRSLRRRGRHVQVGLLPPAAGRPEVPMELVIAYELELLGSHGMAAHEYPRLMAMVSSGALRPERLVNRRIGLEETPKALAELGNFPGPGITVALP